MANNTVYHRLRTRVFSFTIFRRLDNQPGLLEVHSGGATAETSDWRRLKGTINA